MNADWMQAEWPAPDAIVAGTTLRSYSSERLPCAGQPCYLRQVHGNVVVEAREYAQPPEADASVGGAPGVICVVRTADCLPVIFCRRDGTAFASAHAGWRGLVAGVLENTVAALNCPPTSLLVWFGPAISQAAFEVGDEVREAFLVVDKAAAEHFIVNAQGRWQADLFGLARQRLHSAGVSSIYGGGLCTFADRARFHSYRRNPACGRLKTFIGVRSRA